MIICKIETGLELSHQDKFPETCACCKCGKKARVALVAFEGTYEDRYVCESRCPEEPPVFWPHDAIAVAVYFCVDHKCGTATTLWNQA